MQSLAQIFQFLIRSLLFPVLLGCSFAAVAQPGGHAHNDYEHGRPLFHALELGFISVEADVHVFGGRLLVGHNRVTENSPTLETLYLKPLDSLIGVNRGSVRAGDGRLFLLMIDFKTDAALTYQVLKQELEKRPTLLCQGDRFAVKIFISGNRPVTQLQQDGFPGPALDGRPTDLDKGFTTSQMPVVSDTYRNWCAWSGRGEPDATAFDAIKKLAMRVHAEKKLLRLWAIPDHPTAWRALREAGVDLINTDRLVEYARFVHAGY